MPPHASPTAEASIDRNVYSGRLQGGGSYRSRPILGRWLPQEDAPDARAKVCCPADGECVDVEWSLLKPSGVVGDKYERAETDLAALSQTSA